ncbi:MAG: hypothetical protein HZB61_15300 [Nitrospirae bacterium]|nr:hypothetical protein [Nitrospirota bacterium]
MTKFKNSTLVSDTRFVGAGFLPVQERDVSNAITREYTWGLNLGGGIGGLLSLKQSGQNYFYLYDGKGNVSALVDSTQNLVASYRYDVFGRLLKRTGTLDQPFRFSTKQYDEQTGLLYYGYRFNNPAIGKWMTRDPLSEQSDINLYRMVGNSAVNWIDPWGLKITQMWRPLAGGAWPVGYHTAINVNGQIYGFGKEGVRRENQSDYGWGSHEVVIYEGDEYDQAMLGYLRNAAAGNEPRFTDENYSVLGNNCISFVDCTIREVLNPEEKQCQ